MWLSSASAYVLLCRLAGYLTGGLPFGKPPAELSQAERSEAPPREARQAAEGGQHFDVSEPREGRQIKLGCDSAAAIQLPRPNADSCFSGFVGTARAGLLSALGRGTLEEGEQDLLAGT